MSRVLDPGRYFGRQIRSWDQGAFSLQITRYGGATHVPAHAHKLPYVCFVLAGAYRERSGTDERACDAGTVVVHAGGARHSDRFGAAGGLCLNVAWNGDGGAILLHRTGRALPVGSWRAPRLRELGVGLAEIASGRRAPHDPTVERQMCAVAEELAGLADADPGERAPPWLALVDAKLDDRQGEETRIGELARLAGVHRTTLLRAFRRHRGTSVRQAIRRRHLDRAIDALLHSRDPLADLALRCGFADQSHLCRALRAAMGTSPARARATLYPGCASCVQEPARGRP